ncbi:MAG TPA: class I SAM-dependent methyltransferase, partial [Pseudonocardiaceae bacterium]|nr:class I SAM-dependent methyltransferase [Pseudonocardiaceae bacterium]
MTRNELHLDRARAESFGPVAEDYDRYRPTFPDELIDDLVAGRPAAVLDVGCGTGKATVLLAKRGLDVLGVELDERMAEIARGHGIPVEVGAFETWDDGGRQFDLITFAQSWHWINPELGIPKVATLLRSGGVIARFWNFYVVDEPVRGALDAVYREHVPEIHPHTQGPTDEDRTIADPFAANDLFTAFENKMYGLDVRLSADHWVAMVSTFSDHRQLAPDRLAVLQRESRATIESFGGAVPARHAAFAQFARR